MFPSRQGNGAPAPSQSDFGESELSNVITAPASCGTTPTNAADLCCWVVPVFAAIGRFQPTWAAAAADVPPGWSSLLSALSSVFARGGSTAWLHGASVTGTGFPFASVIDSTGL